MLTCAPCRRPISRIPAPVRAISRTIRTFSATVQRRRSRFLTAPTRRPTPSALILAICPTPARYHYDELILLLARDANPWATATRFRFF